VPNRYKSAPLSTSLCNETLKTEWAFGFSDFRPKLADTDGRDAIASTPRLEVGGATASFASPQKPLCFNCFTIVVSRVFPQLENCVSVLGVAKKVWC
jgi:hypothetical protein